MLRVAAVFVAVAFAVPAVASEQPTKWVKARLENFQECEVRSEYQLAFGWGRGSFKGKTIEWLAYTAQDGRFWFEVSPASYEDAQPEGWNVLPYEIEGMTFIGIPNEWVGIICPKGEPCDHQKVTDHYINLINRQLKGLHLRAVDYF